MARRASLLALVAFALFFQPLDLSAQSPTNIFADGFESSWVHRWDAHQGAEPLPMLDVDSALSGVTMPLPVGGTNAKERALMVHYLGTGKSIDGAARQQLPFRAYFAACNVETESPSLFVSLTLADTSASANPDHPRVGSVFELEYDSSSGLLEPTANHAVLDICNESHGIAVSSDCSRVAVLCAPIIEEPATPSFGGTLRDLVAETSQDSFYTRQTDNTAIIDGIAGLTEAERQARYLHNGEIWLLVW